jgi:hypothetical protein
MDAEPAAASVPEQWEHWVSARARGAYANSPCYLLVEPFRRQFSVQHRWSYVWFYFFGGLWTLAVWSFFGGAITRIAAVRLGRDERVGLREAVVFAGGKFVSYFTAPLLPLLAIAFLAVPLSVLGVLMRTDFGVFVAGLTWFAVTLTGLVMALFGLGLLFSWPLMWSTISTEATDAFDAISRSYAYTFQRPLQYLAYALLSLTLGALGWLVVAVFCQSVIAFAHWGTSWGSGAVPLEQLQATWHSGIDQTSPMFSVGATLIGFFNACVRAFLTAYIHSFFWVAAAGVYLLLRRDADQTELDDVNVGEEGDTIYGVPLLTPDEAGVPGVPEADTSENASSTESPEEE